LAFYVPDSARADSIVFNNLGTGTNLAQNFGWAVQGADQGVGAPYQAVAAAFTPTNTTNFTELEMALRFQATGEPNPGVTVDLMSDSSGSPGAVLESWFVDNLPSVCCTLQTLSGDGTIPLISGTQYWIAALPGDNFDAASWIIPADETMGPLSFQGSSGGAWVNDVGTPGFDNFDLQPAFEVLGSQSESPEPGTAGLFLAATGMLTLFGKLRMR
jgi:hypothetical protein